MLPVPDTASMTPSPALCSPEDGHVKPALGSPIQLKEHLEYLAHSELPIRLGKRYTEIVLQCLRCLDESTALSGRGGKGHDGKESGFGVGVGGEDEEIVDEDGAIIGVRYIENVLQKILEITV